MDVGRQTVVESQHCERACAGSLTGVEARGSRLEARGSRLEAYA